MRLIDADKVIEQTLSVSLTGGVYGRGLSRGLELARCIINTSPTVDLDEIRKETAREILTDLYEEFSRIGDEYSCGEIKIRAKEYGIEV